MHLYQDTYKTIAHSTNQVLFKDRKSKFYGYAFPVEMETEVKPVLETLKKQHPTANHFCYAWRIGVIKETFRANDDGEPKNSAGMPIYGQIQSQELTNVLVVIVRIFGGTKLGVGGLINAYKTTAQIALETATIEDRIIETKLKLDFDYPHMNDIMRVLKKWNVRMVSQKMKERCSLIIAIPQSKTEAIHQHLKKIHQLKIAIL